MKKNKMASLAVVALSTITLISGVTFAWFTSQTEALAVDVSTAKIQIKSAPLSSFTNKLPGEVILMNPNLIEIANEGTRDAIVEISFEDQIKAKLASGAVPVSPFDTEYTNNGGVYEFSEGRLAEVASLEMKPGSGNSQYTKVDDKYYIVLSDSNGAGKVKLEDVYLTIKGELGGQKMNGGSLTPSRQFEQGSIFSVSYKATAVQRSREAIKDVFGDTVYNALPASYYVD